MEEEVKAEIRKTMVEFFGDEMFSPHTLNVFSERLYSALWEYIKDYD